MCSPSDFAKNAHANRGMWGTINIISTFPERKERTQRQCERMPCISVCLRQGTKPYHDY